MANTPNRFARFSTGYKPATSQPTAPAGSPARSELPLRASPTAPQSMARSSTPRDIGSSAAISRSERFQGRGPWKVPTSFSDQQDEIINCTEKTVVANAFAGTGKTTTAAGYAAQRPTARVLYMPFGKTVQLEAMKRFPPNTWCQTINSAAWDAASPALRGKLTNSFTPLLLRDELKIRTNREAGLVLRLLNQFMSSSDHELKPSHARAISSWNASEAEIQTAMSIARLAWFRMISETDKLPLPHDALLKLWSLRKPRLDFDYIIFDEAQDTNAVTADIISQQHHATRLYIGDRHQSVYAFRGATNAMEQMSENRSARQFHLSQTWRFGPKIAGVANLILNEIKGEQTPIIGMGSDGDWKKGARYTKLSRTNAQLFRDAAARQGEGVHWAGANGIAGYNINRVLEGYNLFAGRECKDSTLRRFRSWRDAQDYAEESRDNEVRMLVSVIDEFRHDTPDIVKTLVANEVRDVNDSSVVYSTAHKAKGLDWDYVELAEDFEVLNQVEKDLAKDAAAPIDDQEVNLLYVACTRAKTSLHLNSETRNWIANIEKHRQDRTLSMQRLQLRQDALRQSRESLRA